MNTQNQGPAGRPLLMGVASPAPAALPAPTAPAPEAFIDKVEVAKRLGKTVRCIDNWMKRGLIPFFKIGRSVCFKWSDVEQHLSQTCRVCRRKY